MTALYLNHEQEVTVTRHATRDEWDNDDTTSTHYFNSVHLNKTPNNYNMYREEFDTIEDVAEGDIIYVLIAQYSTGDSFGHYHNSSYHIVVASKDEDYCYKVKRAVDPDDIEKIKRMGDHYRIKFDGREYYRPWVGYFENLENLSVYQFIVEK